MNKKGKILACLLALALLAAATGCGGGGGEAASPSVSAGEQSQAPASTGTAPAPSAWQWGDPEALPFTEEKVTLTTYITKSPELLQANSDPENSDGMMELEARTNVHISFLWGDFGNASIQFNVLIASGDYPDLLPNVSENYTGGLAKAYEDGIITELTGLVDQYMPNYKYIISGDEEKRLAAYTDEGQMLQICQYQLNRQVVLGPFIRSDWLDQIGVKAGDVRTYDDYHDVLTQFKTKLGKPNALWVGTTGVPEFNYLAAGYGVAVDQSIYGTQNAFFQKDGKIMFGPISDGYIDYITMMHDWYAEGLVYPDFMSQTYPATMFEQVSSGNIGICTAYTAFVSVFKGMSGDADFEMTGLYDAVKKKGDKLHLRRDSGAYEGRGTAISSLCKTPDIAAKWLDYGYSYDGFILGNYGIDGITYTSTGEALDMDPPLTDFVLKNPDGLTLQQAQEKYIGTSGLHANLDDQQLWSDDLVAATDRWAELSDNAYVIPKAVTMSSEENQEYSELFADIATYASENQVNFIIGDTPLSKYDDFVAMLKEMGIERCIQLRQQALDRYYGRG